MNDNRRPPIDAGLSTLSPPSPEALARAAEIYHAVDWPPFPPAMRRDRARVERAVDALLVVAAVAAGLCVLGAAVWFAGRV